MPKEARIRLGFPHSRFSRRIRRLAGVAKLADALDLGSSALGVWVQVPPSAPAADRKVGFLP